MPSSAPRWRPCWREATWGANDGPGPCWESITHNHGPESLSSKASVPSCFRRNTWHTLTYRIIPPKPNKGHNHLRPTKGSLNLFALLNARIVSYTCRAQTHKPHTFWSLPCMLSATTSWYNKRSVISHFLFTTLCWFSSCSCVATCPNEMWVLFICKSVCSGCTFP